MTSYKTLEAWKKGMKLIKEVYLLTKLYPKEELFALTSPSKRAAVSIPANIAEGIGRNYKKDTVQFLHISRGSAYELQTLLKIAVMVELITEEKLHPIGSLIDEEIKIINGLINAYETRGDLK